MYRRVGEREESRLQASIVDTAWYNRLLPITSNMSSCAVDDEESSIISRNKMAGRARASPLRSLHSPPSPAISRLRGVKYRSSTAVGSAAHALLAHVRRGIIYLSNTAGYTHATRVRSNASSKIASSREAAFAPASAGEF